MWKAKIACGERFTWELKRDSDLDEELEDDEELVLIGTPKNDVVRASLNQFKSLSQYKRAYRKNAGCYEKTLKNIKNFMNKYVWCLPFTRQLFRDKQDIITIPCKYCRTLDDGLERVEKTLFLIKNLDEATIQKPIRELFCKLLDSEEQFLRKYVKDLEEVVEFRKKLTI